MSLASIQNYENDRSKPRKRTEDLLKNVLGDFEDNGEMTADEWVFIPRDSPPDAESRGEAIHRRWIALGVRSVRDLAARSGVSRDAITAAGAGTASPATYDRLEVWLTRHEKQIGSGDAVVEGQIEIELTGDDGVRVAVRGPISEAEQLEGSVLRLMREMSAQPRSAGPEAL